MGFGLVWVGRILSTGPIELSKQVASELFAASGLVLSWLGLSSVKAGCWEGAGLTADAGIFVKLSCGFGVALVVDRTLGLVLEGCFKRAQTHLAPGNPQANANALTIDVLVMLLSLNTFEHRWVTENQNQASFSPFGPHEVSVPIGFPLVLCHRFFHDTHGPKPDRGLPIPALSVRPSASPSGNRSTPMGSPSMQATRLEASFVCFSSREWKRGGFFQDFV